MRRFSQTMDILITVTGCLTGIIIAVIEGRRAPVEETLRQRMDMVHDRLATIEQKYMAYPAAREMLEQWAAMETMQTLLLQRMDAVEGIVASVTPDVRGKS